MATNAEVSAAEEIKNVELISTTTPTTTMDSSKKNDIPLILSDELISLPTANGSTKDTSIDELTSLEREIAEMHHVSTIARVEDTENLAAEVEKADKVLVEMQTPGKSIMDSTSSNDKPAEIQHSTTTGNGEVAENTNETAAYEHDDLLAVLIGTDNNTDNAANLPDLQTELAPSVTTDSDLIDGAVTIEGEGQFQIMEIDDVDDDDADVEEALKEEKPLKPIAGNNIALGGKSFGTAMTALTPEEVRAVAMEQMAGLNNARDRQRRRKQDIKTLQVVESSDLVTALGADWSDDETPPPAATESTISSESTATTKSIQTKTTDAITSTMNASAKSLKNQTLETAKPSGVTVKVEQNSSPLKASSSSIGVGAAKIKQENKKQIASKIQESVVNVIKKEDEVPAVLPQLTGFKRTRIIKRKIIWDPDAPETQFSYAQLVRNSSSLKPATPTPAASSASVVAKKETVAPAPKKMRPTTPKEPRKTTPTTAEHAEKKPAPVKTKALTTAATNTAAQQSDDGLVKTIAPVKRRAQTPIANGAAAAAAKKKKISEIDRLMGDEGAVNMLNSLESERKITEQETDDKPHRPLMRSRASTISERIVKRETTPTKKETVNAATKAKRTVKPKASATWDYVYKQQASEDAMIIRRRSNSSYSSTASLHRLSLDAPPPPPATTSKHSAKSSSGTTSTPNSAEKTTTTTHKSATKSSPKTPNTSHGSNVDTSPHSSATSSSKQQSTPKSFEFAKPESKSNQKTNRRTKSPIQATNPLTSDMKKATSNTTGNKRAPRSPAATVEDSKEKSSKASAMAKEDTASTTTATTSSSSSGVAPVSSDVIVRKSGKMAQIIFNTHKAKIDYTFTAQMMNKLVDILDTLSNDKDCNAVVMMTNSPHFCHGIDFTDLTVGTAERRKHAAINLATAAKNYLKALATFPKPLIAGVNGNNIGLGVTQLPLFDVVIASDKGTYETPYAKIGQVPEGYCIWNKLTKIRGTFKTKLFWLCEKLHSTESALSGLINKLTSPSKVNEDATTTARKIANMPAASFRVMKKTTIDNHLDIVLTALDEEFDVIIEQWTSNECYEHFKKYLESRNV